MRVPSPSDRTYACARQFTMNLRYEFNNCAFAHVHTYVLSTQLCVLRDQLRVLRVRNFLFYFLCVMDKYVHGVTSVVK